MIIKKSTEIILVNKHNKDNRLNNVFNTNFRCFVFNADKIFWIVCIIY